MSLNKTPLRTIHVPAKTGVGFQLKKGQTLRVIDIEGEQVVDLVAFSQANPQEYLSSARSIDYAMKVYFTEGDILYSINSRPMLRIVADSVGKHDFMFAPCSQEMYEISYGVTEAHPNCLDNLTQGLVEHGIGAEQIPVPFNIFMNSGINKDGTLEIYPPLSKAGDRIDLRAEMDLILSVSACPADKCNNYSHSPIQIEIYDLDQ
jgi:hypothetical protein